METTKNNLANPFPGLRPFEPHETSLFFGRDGQSDQLLAKLIKTGFVAVVGTSGSGKSSLVRAGLLPALRSGITDRGSDWHVAVMRPGADPMGNLARALVDVKQPTSEANHEDSEIYPALCETILRRSSSGMIDAVNWLKGRGDFSFANVLVVVDQFEELFRYKRESTNSETKDVAAAFVNLLLTATAQMKNSIYVVLTMRSDHLGDCAQFLGLPEAISRGQYLIPRMTRNERRAAIEGPIGVCHGKISQFLVSRLLNDAGDSPENLPVLQHVLMRTWDRWKSAGTDAIELEHYYATGGMAEALSRHGDEVYDRLLTADRKEIARQLFSCLVQTDQKGRESRRPTSLRKICQIIRSGSNHENSERELSDVATEVLPVVEVFRSHGVSFLTPPPSIQLDSQDIDVIVDISHESLITGWQTLRRWVGDEAKAAKLYQRLAETAKLHQAGMAGFYRGRDLRLASAWKKSFRPSKAWGTRYDLAYDQAMRFLRDSKIQRIISITLVAVIILVVAVSGLVYANALRSRSRAEELAANSNAKATSDPQAALYLAVQAVRTSPTDHALAALRNSLFEHSARVTIPPIRNGARLFGAAAAALSPNGKFVATANRDGKARIWVWETEDSLPSQIDIIDPKIGFITNVSFDATGERIILSGQTKAAIWNVNKDTGQNHGVLAELTGHRAVVNRASFSRDGQYAITSSSDGSARVWKINQGSGKQIAVLDHRPDPRISESKGDIWVKSAVFNPTNTNYILTACWDGTARIWSWNQVTGAAQQIDVSVLHQNGINNAVFSEDGKYVLTAGSDGLSAVFEWNSSTGKLGRLLATLRHDQPVLDASFDPRDFKNIITTSADNAVRIWRLSDEQIAFVATDGSKTDLYGSFPISTKNAQLTNALFAYSDWATSVSFSQTGQYVLTTGYDGTVSVWRDIYKQEKLEEYLDSYRQPVLAVDFNNTGKEFLTGSSDHTVRVWDVTTERELKSQQIYGSALHAVFNDDNSRIAIAGSGGEVFVWSLNGGFETLGGHKGAVLSIAFSPDGTYIVSGGKDGQVRVWKLTQSGYSSETVIQVGGSVDSVAFSPDGSRVVTGSSDGSIRTWMIPSGSLNQNWRRNASVRFAVFSPDGKSVAAVSDDGTIAIIESETGRDLHQMTGYENGSAPTPVFRIAFSHNGRYLATAGYDSIVRIWDVSTGKQLFKITEKSEDPNFNNIRQNQLTAQTTIDSQLLVNDVAFSPDDKFIIAGRGDSRSVHVFAWSYFADSRELLNRAEKLLNK